MGTILKENLKIKGAHYAVKVHQHDASLPWLLMLHGFMGDGRVFHPLVEHLSNACNPVTIDLLGHGESEKVFDAGRYHEEHQIHDIAAIIKQLGLSPVFLYGYSMGGRLALKTAFQNPDLINGLILESTTYGILDEEQRTQRRTVDARRAKKIAANYEAFLSKWEELALFQSPVTIDHKLAAQYRKIHLQQHPKAMAASLIGFGTGSMEPVRDPDPKFSKPAMILAGTDDQKYIEISHSMVSYFANVHSCHIPAGHRIHLDNPGKLSRKINHFIDQNSTL